MLGLRKRKKLLQEAIKSIKEHKRRAMQTLLRLMPRLKMRLKGLSGGLRRSSTCPGGSRPLACSQPSAKQRQALQLAAVFPQRQDQGAQHVQDRAQTQLLAAKPPLIGAGDPLAVARTRVCKPEPKCITPPEQVAPQPAASDPAPVPASATDSPFAQRVLADTLALQPAAQAALRLWGAVGYMGAASRRPAALLVAAAGGGPMQAVRQLQHRRLGSDACVSRMQRGPLTFELFARDMHHLLSPREWLNDESINFYMRLIQERNDRQYAARAVAGLPPHTYCFNTFFYTQLTNTASKHAKQVTGFHINYEAVARWTQPRRTHTVDCVLTRDLLLVPINFTDAHWCMAAIWPHKQLIQVYDSLGGSEGHVMAALEEWYVTDAAEKGVPVLTPLLPNAQGAGHGTQQLGNLQQGWDVQHLKPGERKLPEALHFRKQTTLQGVPRQQDGAACGVFACAYAELLARGAALPWDFAQADVRNLRLGMAAQVLAGVL